jgi:hypothetical protein
MVVVERKERKVLADGGWVRSWFQGTFIVKM